MDKTESANMELAARAYAEQSVRKGDRVEAAIWQAVEAAIQSMSQNQEGQRRLLCEAAAAIEMARTILRSE